MPSRQPIARIRLSRSLRRLLGLPLVALVAGITAIAVGRLVVPGMPGIALAGAGAVVMILAVVAAAILLSIRVEVQEAAVRVRRLGGGRSYALVPGPVTRVRLRGERASSLRSIRPVPGWQLGAARLRGEERIDVVRLAPTDTAILVPTDRGRLAIAAANEEELLSALSRAGHARQRLAEAAAVEKAAAAEEPAAAQAHEVVEQPEAEAPAPAVDTPPALMTGIERARFEAEQAAAMAAAEAAALSSTTTPDAVEAAPGEAVLPSEAAPIPRRRRVSIRPAPNIVLVLLPLVGASVAWGIGLLLDRMPAAESDLGRLTVLALVLAGPVATVGAIMARIWWPRIVGVVVAGGLAAAVFVGRSLIGG